jgi:hypothetical protein
MLNKKGSSSIYYFMIGILFFLLGLALAPSLSEVIQGDDVRNSTQLDCSNESISNQNKAICYQVDTFTPLFVGLLFGFAGIILMRITGG